MTATENPAASPSLDLPLYGASFGQAISRFFRKYATFSGRASRSEYWWWVLASFLVYVVLTVATIALGVATGTPSDTGDGVRLGPIAVVGFVLIGVWFVVTLIPQFAVTVRRLHDANLSGWMVLLRLVPSVGDVIVLILTILPASPLGTRFDRR
ncbi:MAG: DUF805 domain-containing protein [Micrococcales bacterium]|mgnify:CR=1 FL=1|nr:DUF805 domain-containing protein [Micrococcales bacterium]OJX66735.1 MAG: hypothetical protein BGO94_07805 [Micrococcales bacterium 72-143]